MNLVRRILITQGWCLHSVERLNRLGGVIPSMYAIEHFDIQEGSHIGCSEEKCMVSAVDLKSHEPVHTQHGCCCDFIAPDKDAVYNLLDRGHVPVFKLRDHQSGSCLALETGQGSENPYVAFSHVWSDGKGSITEVGLPRCQIRDLQKCAGTSYFWIDALGVPGRSDMRRKAIIAMADTYRSAIPVVVLTSTLRRCTVSAARKDKFFRLYISNWMSRMWTLQEALLAKSLYFQLLESPQSAAELMCRNGDDEQNRGHLSPVEMKIFMAIFGVIGTPRVDGPLHMETTDLFTHMRGRNTSHSADETLATCSLAGISVSTLVDVSPERRMREFLRQLGRIPAALLFQSGERKSLDSRIWTPGSLMRTNIELSQTHTAVYSEEGLIGEYHSLGFDSITELSHGFKEGMDSAILLYIESTEKTFWEVGLGMSQSVPPGGMDYRCALDRIVIHLYAPHILGSMSPAVAVLHEKHPPLERPSSRDSAGYVDDILRCHFQGSYLYVRRIEAIPHGQTSIKVTYERRKLHITADDDFARDAYREHDDR